MHHAPYTMHHTILGGARDGLQMSWDEGHFWRATQDLPDNVTIRYKVVCVRHAGEAQWEVGDDRLLELDQQPVAVERAWNSTHNGTITPLPVESILENGTGEESSPGNGDEEAVEAVSGNGTGDRENGSSDRQNASCGDENGSGGGENGTSPVDKPTTLLGNMKRLLRSFSSKKDSADV